MKRNGLTKLLFVVGMAAGLVIAGFYSCEKETIVPNANTVATKTIGIDGYLPDLKQICG